MTIAPLAAAPHARPLPSARTRPNGLRGRNLRATLLLTPIILLAANSGGFAQETTAPAPDAAIEAPSTNEPPASNETGQTETQPPAESENPPAEAQELPSGIDEMQDGTSETLTPQDEADPADSPLLPDEMSPLGMFLNADIVVKLVMIGLAFASILTWTIAFSKTLELAGEIRRARRGRRWLAEAPSLEHALMRFESARKSDVVGNLIRAAGEEVRMSPRNGRENVDGIKERIRSRLDRIELAAGRHVSRSTGLLATIGSTAPFVGLFGTVWGIMNSFIGISKAQTTNLAVVAPGIAEALLATALGLVAAIPAVVIYNMFARRTATYRAVLGDASAEILRHVSRDADRWSASAPLAAE